LCTDIDEGSQALRAPLDANATEIHVGAPRG
jgi:hypothetical protein